MSQCNRIDSLSPHANSPKQQFISHTKACELLYWSVYTQLLVFMVVQNSILSNGEEKTRIIFGFSYQ